MINSNICGPRINFHDMKKLMFLVMSNGRDTSVKIFACVLMLYLNERIMFYSTSRISCKPSNHLNGFQ